MIARGARAVVRHPWIVIALSVIAILGALVFLLPDLDKVPQTTLGLPAGTDSVRARSVLQEHFPPVPPRHPGRGDRGSKPNRTA